MNGSFLIAGEAISTPETFRAYDPSTGEQIDPPFSISTPNHIAQACAAADAAFGAFRATSSSGSRLRCSSLP